MINNKTVISLNNISKKYILHHEKPTLVESLFKKKEEFWALKNISLQLKKGEKLGIIGPNGAGKSTLLKLISGITYPTKGKVKTKGKIASLIDLSAGFHPDLTGEENIYINGLLLGMNKKEIKNSFKKIIAFSGIKKFIDSPLNTYSSGMVLRLGFSIAVHSNPDILIIDEVISSGDEKFRIKSFNKIQDFFKAKKTIIFVSHNLEAIKKLCPQVLWLDKGKTRALGKTNKIVKKYIKESQKNNK
ncbi:sugar ABC transporter ATP-binding protein [Candidatus Beckwithbacteria bacterium CG10_big_fil_rev_8_21_14_0_10_34_10]|uniref:Sugar ABC transporter ATP-binding protein n=1 Tax=Candidatus Beckwithbacteria bacterium CG10_big_fil_rev_8_21_14_0_10_34_10 TaxID=1974495 RepID=A0A2H0W9Z1_9BACT|nr:MAG: sugar ABC transporter ATP-binding protein [Candidatus Beckwithbacteria bacterium CG10_big_fil_rev_8_21_14_0_10_34_10]